MNNIKKHSPNIQILMVATVTRSRLLPLKIKRATEVTLLMSGQRGSNSRLFAWEANILPLNYARITEL